MRPHDDPEDDAEDWSIIEDDSIDLVQWAASMIQDGFIPMAMPARLQ